MIVELTPEEVISYCRSILGLKTNVVIDDELLASLLRRCAGISCPCSPTTLRATLFEGMSYLSSDGDALNKRIDKIINDMTTVGDLLESSDIATEDPNVKSTWVFAAPPSFIVRKNGNIYLAGIAPDQENFLSPPLESRILYSGVTRSISPQPGENLAATLEKLGINKLSQSVWLKSPEYQTPRKLLTNFKRRLANVPECDPISGIEILDSATKVTYYRGRWRAPKNQTGIFVARRTQEFGARIWSFVQLVDGTLKRIIDLPVANYLWRGCDAAWHLQMAIDYCRKQPQRYRKRNTGLGARFDFFSPLPLWSERRLMLFGRKLPREKSLFSYELPASEIDEEEKYLQECLWLFRENDNNAMSGNNAND